MKSGPAPQYIAFDIEIANIFDLLPEEDLDQYGPFDISCAAAVCHDEGHTEHWVTRDDTGRPARCLDAVTAHDMLRRLREWQREGAHVCAWNGLSFDLRWLGVAAKDVALARDIALDLYDPMFQFFVQRGFPVGLSKVAEGFGLAQKKLMESSDAPKEWARGNHQFVLDYVAMDCCMTNHCVKSIQEAGCVKWVTRQGSLSVEPMPELRQVRELLDAPCPDTSWMNNPIPRTKFTGWLSPSIWDRLMDCWRSRQKSPQEVSTRQR